MNFDLKRLNALAVDLHGQRVGVISRLAGDKQIFSLDSNYVDNPDRPTLSLSLKSQSGGLLTSLQKAQRRVPPFFSNLLPEGHLRSYLAERAGLNPEREFFLLAALGSDLPGAVRVYPMGDRDVEGDPAAEIAADPKRISGAMRFSLAGVQLKFSAIAESSGGLTIPAQGIGGSWIVKLPSMRFGSVSENEFVMLELARAIGIAVPRTQLIPVQRIDGLPAEAAKITGNALAVERFDRGPDGERIHMEDFAQVFGLFPENKYKSVSYANIARILLAETGEPGVKEFVTRLVFSVMIGNADMHLKNWSLLYPDQRKPVLSPAYDFVSTLPYIPDDRLALSFGGSKNIGWIDAEQIRRFASKAGLALPPMLAIARESVNQIVAAWEKLDAKALLPQDLRSDVGDHIESACRLSSKALSG